MYLPTPLGPGIEPGGTPYEITGEWTASFSADVAKERTRSVYFWQGKQ